MIPEVPDRDPLQMMLSRLGVGVITTDPEGTVIALSPFAEFLTGWPTAQAYGHSIDRVLRLVEGEPEPPKDPAEGKRLKLARNPGGVDESVLITKDGQHLDIEHTVTPIRDERGRVSRLLIAFHDISQRKLASLQLARLATHDPLTGLWNRHAFTTSVENAIERARGGTPFALCQVDLDQFALVYHTSGHDAADDLLQWVGALLREEAGGTGIVARMGGDVFAVLLERTELDDARKIAESLLRRLREFHFTWGDQSFPVSASIGLIPVQEGDLSVAELFNAADHACMVAKRSGRNQVCICRLDDEQLALRHQEMEWISRLRKHINEGNVFLYGQPIQPLGSDRVAGLYFEVLLRMADEEGERMSPARLIPAAERFGLMSTLDRWVIRNALETLRALPRATLGKLRLCSINLSSVSLNDRTILEFIHTQLSQARVPAQRICFELTETAVVENLPQARWLIGELQAIGCRFALDDFGSGIASYAHLKGLPVDYLKIAGEFLEGIVSSPLDRAMVESIAQIGRVLKIDTIAESITNQAALDIVRSIGIGFAQGNFVGPPRPLRELLRG
jgi:diguanylate cyclase (GGDEF)-like protein/PAS domain S-box-containing protein